MNARGFIRNISLIVLVPFAVMAQAPRLDEIPLKNWSAPPYWQPTGPAESHDTNVQRDASLNPLVSLPTQPLVFVAMTPAG